jgi:ATP-dependent helicase/nuclease subunit A
MRARLARGRLIHGLLQRLPDIAAHKRRAAGAAWLHRQGGAPGSADADALLEEALAVLDDPAFSAVFGPGSRAEVALSARGPDGARIDGIADRLVVGVDGVQVIDFKTDRDAPARVDLTPPRILLQLALYRHALRAIFPGQAISCGLLWTWRPRLDHVPDDLLDTALS